MKLVLLPSNFPSKFKKGQGDNYLIVSFGLNYSQGLSKDDQAPPGACRAETKRPDVTSY